MKKWDDKYAESGRYELYLGREEKLAAILKNTKKADGTNYFVFTESNAAKWDKPLKAKTLDKAKKEVETLLKKRYKKLAEQKHREAETYDQMVLYLDFQDVNKQKRKPAVENKYNLMPKDIQKAVVLKPECLKQPPFWRNRVVEAWCLSQTTAKTAKDTEYGTYSSYWIGFYDEKAPAYAGKIRLTVSACGDMMNYNFEKFFDPKEIENEDDLKIQELLLERINWLIDEGIVEIPGKTEGAKK